MVWPIGLHGKATAKCEDAVVINANTNDNRSEHTKGR